MYSKEPALNNLYKSKAHQSLLNPCIFAKSLEMQFPKISKSFFLDFFKTKSSSLFIPYQHLAFQK